jgi:hypothetical protein
MLFDDNGVPYTLGTFVWDGTGVRCEDYHPPARFESPDSIYARSDEVHSGATQHYGNDLSHHSQQLLALKYLSDNAGFDPVVWCRVHFTNNLSIVALHTVQGVWVENMEVPL